MNNFILNGVSSHPQQSGPLGTSQMGRRGEPFAVVGVLVDAYDDASWDQLRIAEDGLLIVDSHGTIVHRGSAHQLSDNELMDKHNITDKSSQIVKLENKGEFLLPGFIDSHIHASQFPNCGLGLDLPLLEWLNTYTFPMEVQYGKDQIFATKSYERAVTSTLSHGTTSAAYYATNDVEASLILAETAERLGQRAMVGKVNVDRNAPDFYTETTPDSLRGAREFVARVQAMKCPTVEPILTPRFAPTCSRELMTGLGELAKEKDVRIQTHLSECKPEIQWVKELEPWAENYTDVYDQCGLLTEKTILAHGVYLDRQELKTINLAGAGIAHCPNSNNAIRSGNMDAIKYHNLKGLKVGLGTDASGGYSPSMVDSIRFSVATSNNVLIGTEGRDRSLDFRGALALATRGSARVCHLEDKVGGFDVGLKFDALRVKMSGKWDTQLFGFETIEDMIQKFCFLGDDRNIAQVWVEGRCVKDLITKA